jgi:hypothetical protein
MSNNITKDWTDDDRVGTFIVVFISASVLFLMIILPGKMTGFHIEAGRGENCVVAEVMGTLDPMLFCSDDIHAVEDALRRYRQMPLGSLKRHK